MNKSKKIVIIILFLVVVWGFIIYKFSDMNTLDSNDDSKNVIAIFLEKGLEFTNDLGITKSHPSDNKIERATQLLNSPLRKVMHASVYFVLSFFIMLAINVLRNKKKYWLTFLITILICFTFALTDEYHQTQVIGRTGQFLDVLIDTSGAILGSLFFGTYFIAYKLGVKSKKEEN